MAAHSFSLSAKMTKGNGMAKWRAAIVAAMAWASLAPVAAEDLHIYNWSDYVNPAVIEAFEKETGIKIVYDTFDQMDIVESKLLAGKTGYDLVVVTASFLPRQIPLNLYLPLMTTA